MATFVSWVINGILFQKYEEVIGNNTGVGICGGIRKLPGKRPLSMEEEFFPYTAFILFPISAPIKLLFVSEHVGCNSSRTLEAENGSHLLLYFLPELLTS